MIANAAALTAESTRDEFLQLLVTQLQNQDPLEPIKQAEFLQQLAQFSALQQLETLNANFEDLLKLQELTQGANLLGRSVVFQRDDDEIPGEGTVEEVRSQDNRLLLTVNGESVPIDRVQSLVARSL